MLNFSTTPPDDPRGVAMPLKRCPAGRGLSAIVTSHDLIGCPTHYYGGRTHPCTAPDCEPCKEGVSWRWHSYLAAWTPTSKLHFLFESTARATEAFLLYRKANNDLRGCGFTARRINTSPNSRVMIETKALDLTGHAIPEAPHLLKVLSIIWNIPLPDMQIDGIIRDAAALNVKLETPRDLLKYEDRLNQRHAAQQSKPA